MKLQNRRHWNEGIFEKAELGGIGECQECSGAVWHFSRILQGIYNRAPGADNVIDNFKIMR